MLRARVEELEKQNAAKDALLAQFAAKEILRSTFAQDNSPLDLTATDEECGLDGEE